MIQSATEEKVGFEAAGSDCTFLYFQNISAKVIPLGGVLATHLSICPPTHLFVHPFDKCICSTYYCQELWGLTDE